MQAIMLDEDIYETVDVTAKQLNISQQAIIKQAVDDYVAKIKQRQQLLSFAGILEEDEADALLKTIKESRVNKNIELNL